MTIHWTPAQEQIVNEELKSGHFQTAEEVVGEALRALQEKERSVAAGINGRQREAVRGMLDFVEKNRTRLDGFSVEELRSCQPVR